MEWKEKHPKTEMKIWRKQVPHPLLPPCIPKHNHVHKFCSANQLHQRRIFDNMEFVLRSLRNKLRSCPRHMCLHSNGRHGALDPKIEKKKVARTDPITSMCTHLHQMLLERKPKHIWEHSKYLRTPYFPICNISASISFATKFLLRVDSDS